MSTLDDGGPAFPFTERNDDGTYYHGSPGMSLRDHFAGLAMQALIAEPPWMEGGNATVNEWSKGYKGAGPGRFVYAAFEMAEAMLAERARRQA